MSVTCLMRVRSSKSLCGACHGRCAAQSTGFKNRLALVTDRICVLSYDNEAGKGDHRHMDDGEQPYEFTTPEALLADFWNDVELWR